MDCLHVQELLSEAADGRAVSPDDLAMARTHCDTCAECATFERGLSVLAHTAAPEAPAGLVESILARIDTEHSMVQHAVETFEEAPARALQPRNPRLGWWAPRLTVFATAAVFLVAALTLTTIGFMGGFQSLLPQKAADNVATTLDEAASERSVAGSEPEAAAAEDSATWTASALAYLSVNGRVFLPVGAITVDASALTTVGPADGRSLEGTTAAAYAYTYAGAEGAVVVQDASGWVLYEPVLRRFAGSDYQLRTGTPITVPGQWPDLPYAYAIPAQSDGSPTFRFFGYDESGTRIFVSVTGSEQDGFAIEPGTAVDDPAAGNPGWTWWAPLP